MHTHYIEKLKKKILLRIRDSYRTHTLHIFIYLKYCYLENPNSLNARNAYCSVCICTSVSERSPIQTISVQNNCVTSRYAMSRRMATPNNRFTKTYKTKAFFFSSSLHPSMLNDVFVCLFFIASCNEYALSIHLTRIYIYLEWWHFVLCAPS